MSILFGFFIYFLEGMKDFIKKIMILDWMWLREFFGGRNMNATLKREDENMEVSCTFIIVMENG
jgi:hypothetical protein